MLHCRVDSLSYTSARRRVMAINEVRTIRPSSTALIRHPGSDFAVVPDRIGGSEKESLGKRRIADIDALRNQTWAWSQRVNQDKITIDWRFTRNQAS